MTKYFFPFLMVTGFGLLVSFNNCTSETGSDSNKSTVKTNVGEMPFQDSKFPNTSIRSAPAEALALEDLVKKPFSKTPSQKISDKKYFDFELTDWTIPHKGGVLCKESTRLLSGVALGDKVGFFQNNQDEEPLNFIIVDPEQKSIRVLKNSNMINRNMLQSTRGTFIYQNSKDGKTYLLDPISSQQILLRGHSVDYEMGTEQEPNIDGSLPNSVFLTKDEDFWYITTEDGYELEGSKNRPIIIDSSGVVISSRCEKENCSIGAEIDSEYVKIAEGPPKGFQAHLVPLTNDSFLVVTLESSDEIRSGINIKTYQRTGNKEYTPLPDQQIFNSKEKKYSLKIDTKGQLTATHGAKEYMLHKKVEEGLVFDGEAISGFFVRTENNLRFYEFDKLAFPNWQKTFVFEHDQFAKSLQGYSREGKIDLLLKRNGSYRVVHGRETLKIGKLQLSSDDFDFVMKKANRFGLTDQNLIFSYEDEQSEGKVLFYSLATGKKLENNLNGSEDLSTFRESFTLNGVTYFSNPTTASHHLEIPSYECLDYITENIQIDFTAEKLNLNSDDSPFDVQAFIQAYDSYEWPSETSKTYSASQILHEGIRYLRETGAEKKNRSMKFESLLVILKFVQISAKKGKFDDEFVNLVMNRQLDLVTDYYSGLSFLESEIENEISNYVFPKDSFNKLEEWTSGFNRFAGRKHRLLIENYLLQAKNEVPKTRLIKALKKMSEGLYESASYSDFSHLFESKIYYLTYNYFLRKLGMRNTPFIDTSVERIRPYQATLLSSDPIQTDDFHQSHYGFYYRKIPLPNMTKGKGPFYFKGSHMWRSGGRNWRSDILIREEPSHMNEAPEKAPDYKKLWEDGTLEGVILFGSDMKRFKSLERKYLGYLLADGFEVLPEKVDEQDTVAFLKEKIESGKLDYLVKEAHSGGDDQNLVRVPAKMVLKVVEKVKKDGQKERIYLLTERSQNSKNTAVITNSDFGGWMKKRKSNAPGKFYFFNTSCSSYRKAINEYIATSDAADNLTIIAASGTTYSFNNGDYKRENALRWLINGFRNGESYDSIAKTPAGKEFIFPNQESYFNKIRGPILADPAEIRVRLFDNMGKEIFVDKTN